MQLKLAGNFRLKMVKIEQNVSLRVLRARYYEFVVDLKRFSMYTKSIKTDLLTPENKTIRFLKCLES